MRQAVGLLAVGLFLAGAAGVWAAEEPGIAYYVVPLAKTAPSLAGQKDYSKVQHYPMLRANLSKLVLYYLEPMERKIKSYTPKKDSMGMDYLPVVVDGSTKTVLFYLHPMDRKTISLKPAKDEMGMDYLPVYEMRIVAK